MEFVWQKAEQNWRSLRHSRSVPKKRPKRPGAFRASSVESSLVFPLWIFFINFDSNLVFRKKNKIHQYFFQTPFGIIFAYFLVPSFLSVHWDIGCVSFEIILTVSIRFLTFANRMFPWARADVIRRDSHWTAANYVVSSKKIEKQDGKSGVFWPGNHWFKPSHPT